jgi:hypothetical protein
MWRVLCVFPAATLVTWVSRVCEMAELHKSANRSEIICRRDGICQYADSGRKEGETAVVGRAAFVTSIRLILPTPLVTIHQPHPLQFIYSFK